MTRARTNGGRCRAIAMSWALAGIPVAAAVLFAVAPAAMAIWRSTGLVSVDSDGSSLGALQLVPAIWRTILSTSAIAILAVVIGAPVGWAMRGTRVRRLGALVLVPLLMPSYFAYAGWGLLRAPRSFLGDLLADGPPWVSAWAGPLIAVWGLALWSWPLAALVYGTSARRVDQAVMDGLELDGPSWRSRISVVIKMTWPGLVGAFLAVMLVMAGSMVPLDVAQVETYSIVLMRWLNLHPSDIPVWRAAWPLMVFAGVGTAAILRAIARAGDFASVGDAARHSGCTPRKLYGWVAVAWGLAVVVPAVLYIANLREPPHPATLATIKRFLLAFWRDSGGAAAASAGVAARVAVVSVVVGFGTWYVATRGPATGGTRSGGAGWRIAMMTTAVLVAMGLVPGVLVGSAIRRCGDAISISMGDSSWIVVWAHASRFSFMSALMGLWLASGETREERDLRVIDGGGGVFAFVSACVARHWPAMAGAALATGVLSFHEIESTVMVWPPGTRNLAQEMLDALHFARDERLAAAAVNLMVGGAAVAYLAGWLALGRESRDQRSQGG